MQRTASLYIRKISSSSQEKSYTVTSPASHGMNSELSILYTMPQVTLLLTLSISHCIISLPLSLLNNLRSLLVSLPIALVTNFSFIQKIFT